MHPLLSIPRGSLVFRVLEPVVEEGSTILLRYRIEGGDDRQAVDFTERIVLPGGDHARPRTDAFDRIVRVLSLAASLSYYKTCIPHTVVVEAGLTPRERTLFESLITNGLAEFAYRNDCPEALWPQIEAASLDDVELPARWPEHPERLLVAVGGGKDSIVSIESLRGRVDEMVLFSVNEYAPIRSTASQAGIELTVATRKLDPLLFELNAEGALNGHVPVTAINSLIGCLTALRAGFDAVVFSNEWSASSGNLTWNGVDVNHQWSKGIEFERLLHDALADSGITYFSFLRPLTELAISRRFAQLTDYHPVFTSCNRAFHLEEGKRRLWCGECPKCRFVFLSLAPFLSKQALLEIFGGRDLFADPAQFEGFLQLLNWQGRTKPFECVGEPDESRVALTLASRQPDWADAPFLGLAEAQECLVDESVVDSVFTFKDAGLLPGPFEKAAREVL